MTLPALFIAHGSPMMALEDNEYTRFLEQLGRELPTPRGIAVFSAHWDDPDQRLTEDAEHGTMHDFYGFPEEMYKITYPAPGSAELATQIRQRFEANNLHAKAVTGRGLDHGVWVILRKMYPDANIPVVALSVDSKRSPHEQYSIGTMLSDLREEGILIIGSGGLVHNLRMVHESDEPDEWAAAFDEWIAEQLTEWNLNNLFAFDKKAPHASDAVPSYGREHFVPLFYALGAADNGRKAKRLFQSYQYGSLSLNCWSFE